jgi:putative transposase
MPGKRRRFSPELKAKIVLEMLREEKTLNELATEYGVHINQIRRWKQTVIEDLPQLFERDSKKLAEEKAAYQEKMDSLYKEVGRLTTELSWLKKKNLALFPRNDRIDLIDWTDAVLSITKQSELLSLNRSSLYYKPKEPPIEDVRIKHLIDEIYTKYPFYGSRRITEQLRRDGFVINR